MDSRDSHLRLGVIQGCFWGGGFGRHGSACSQRRAVGAHVGPDHWASRPVRLDGRDNRMFVEGVLWIVRTGSPWRDLPEVFGEWNSVFRRFSRWSRKGVWQRIFEAMSDDPDFEYLIIDSTIVRAHQHASGAKGGLKIRPSDARAAA